MLARAAVFIASLLAAACAVGVAAPVASPPPTTIAAGVTVGGVRVGGLTSEPARARLRRSVARKLTIVHDARRWRLPPAALDATASVDAAVARALAARPAEALTLPVRVPQVALRAFVGGIAARLERKPVESRLAGLVRGRPFVTRAQTGLAVRRAATERAIRAAFKTNARRPVRVAVRTLRPNVTRASFGPIIVIDRWTNSLRLYRGMSLVREFRVATGTSQYPTPSGTWSIVDKQLNPWWRPPDSEWAKGAEPIPPGPGNPLGTRWMGLSAAAVGIHGTPDAASLGYSRSHGCIRMAISEAEWLFLQVSIGTPVVIV